MYVPLHGIRVIDLTNIVASPLASVQLALMGAEVIKIETPGTGDLSRKRGADPAQVRKGMGVSYFALNAGKKSITLNLKYEEAKNIFSQAARHQLLLPRRERRVLFGQLGQQPLRVAVAADKRNALVGALCTMAHERDHA